MKKWILVIAIAGLILIPTSLYLVDSNNEFKHHTEEKTYAPLKDISESISDLEKVNIEVEQIG